MENESQETGLSNLNWEERQSTDSVSIRSNLVRRLKRNRQTRARFVDSNISKGLAFQIRSLRDKEDWSQQQLAEKIDSNQNAIYRAENPNYGKQTITTLKKIAAAFDVGLAVRFVPFSELVDWESSTPRVVNGLSTAALEIPCFSAEEEAGAFDIIEPVRPQRERLTEAERMTADVVLLGKSSQAEPQSNLVDFGEAKREKEKRELLRTPNQTHSNQYVGVGA